MMSFVLAGEIHLQAVEESSPFQSGTNSALLEAQDPSDRRPDSGPERPLRLLLRRVCRKIAQIGSTNTDSSIEITVGASIE
jgi:hypothetical protein